MHRKNERVGELRFSECRAPNHQTAVTHTMTFDATLSAQQPGAGVQRMTALLGEALLLLGKRE